MRFARMPATLRQMPLEDRLRLEREDTPAITFADA